MSVYTFPAFYNVCYLTALFAQAIMGYFQFGSMMQLAITLKYTDEDEANRKIKMIDLLVIVINTFLLGIFLFLSYECVKIIKDVYEECKTPYNISECEMTQLTNYWGWVGWISGTIYSTLTIALISSFFYLSRALRARFSA